MGEYMRPRREERRRTDLYKVFPGPIVFETEDPRVLLPIKISVPNANIKGALPRSLGDLAMLERLEINGNHITGLPSEIGALTRLNYLKAQGNMIAALPATMGSMTGLMQSWSEFGLEDSPALMEAWEAIKAEAGMASPPP